MSSKQEQYEQAIGKYVLAFEYVCETMRMCIRAMFKHQGLSNDTLIDTLIGEMTSAPLQKTLLSSYGLIRHQNRTQRSKIADVLKKIQSLTTFRNQLLHSAWQVVQNEPSDEVLAVSMNRKVKRDKKHGTLDVVFGFTADHILEQAEIADQLCGEICNVFLSFLPPTSERTVA